MKARDVAYWEPIEHVGLCDDEEIHVERIPFDLAQRSHGAFETLTADLVCELVAQVDTERLRDAVFHGEERLGALLFSPPPSGDKVIVALHPACPRQIELTVDQPLRALVLVVRR